MTALIYKAALPTYSSAADLAANADENLVLNDAGTAYELEPGQSGASVRYLTGAEVQASRGTWSIAGADVVATNGTVMYPVFDTITGTGAGTIYGLDESTYWASDVPLLLTPGIYEVNCSVTWPSNLTGGRHLELAPFYETDTGLFLPGALLSDGTGVSAGNNNGLQQMQTTMYVWDDMNPIGIGLSLKQNSGSSLTIDNANVNLWAYKVAEF